MKILDKIKVHLDTIKIIGFRKYLDVMLNPYNRIKDWIFYIKDYERLEYNFSCILDKVTNSKMSKTNYDLDTMYAVIDDELNESYLEIYRSDIKDILDQDSDEVTDEQKFIEIKEYLHL
jgi:hypothetical protein